jgi:hypothetical protein
MKQFYYTLALSFVITLSIGQSKNTPKLHLSTANLENLLLKNQAEFKQIESSQVGTTDETERFINFNPVLLDTKKATALKILSDLGDLSHATVFTIYQSDIPIIEQELWSINTQETSIDLTTVNAINSDQLASYTDGEITIPTLNTYLQLYKPRNKKSFNGIPFIQLGAFSNDMQKAFKGQIAELLVYNSVLRGKTRQSIETYLALKYGISLTNGKDYLSFDKKIIFNLENRQGYSSRIAGIGRDDASGLLQKQAYSTEKENLITIGAGEIAPSNTANKALIEDGTFLIWSDNNALPTLTTTADATYPPLLQRHWMMQATGVKAAELNTTMQLDITTVFNDKTLDPSKYLLVIDASGAGTFLPENVKYIMATSLENNILTFKNIKWDTDNSGADSFSFALRPDLEVALTEEKPINCGVGNNGVLSYTAQGGIPPYAFELKTNSGLIKNWKSTDSLYPENKITQLGGANYTLTTTDRLETKKEATYALVNPLPITVNLGADKRFEFDQKEMTLDGTVLSDEILTYQWTSDTGFTADAPKISITTPGTYTVTVTTSKGCTTTDSIVVKGSFIKSFVLYPNTSTDGNYNIQLVLESPDNYTIHVFDLTGKLISTVKESNKAVTTITGKTIHSKGTYNVVFQGTTEKASRLLIVE